MVRFSRSRQGEHRRPEANGDLSEWLVTVSDPASAASEAYRTLRTSLLYSLADTPPKVVVVTSPDNKEAKSITCANVAVVLAEADKNTLVMDCDLRNPIMHKIFGLRNSYGVAHALVGTGDLDSWWQEAILGLSVAAAGSVPPNPTELLGSTRFDQLLGQARKEFDHVLIDAPLVGLFSDPAIIATQSDGVLLVLDSRNAHKSSLRETIRNLESVGARIICTVINDVKVERGRLSI